MTLQKATGTSPETPAVTTNNAFDSTKTAEVVKRFLTTLEPRPEAVFNIEAHSPTDKTTGEIIGEEMHKVWAELSHDGVHNLIPELAKLNAKGAGIYIAVNEFNGARRKENLARVRCVHADFDKASALEDLKEASDILPPTLVVQSSPNKFHAYWRLGNSEVLSSKQVEALNRQLVTMHGADKAAIDCTRLLRIPGFNHTKGFNQGNTPEVLLLDEGAGAGYTAEELASAFQPVKKKQQKTPPTSNQPVSEIAPETITSITHAVEKLRPEAWSGTKHQQPETDESSVDFDILCHAVRVARAHSVPEENLPETIKDVFMRSGAAQFLSRKGKPDDYLDRSISNAIAQGGEFEVFDISGVPLIQNFVPIAIDPLARGDVANAELYAAANRGKLLYVTEQKSWLLWDGTRWATCKSGEEIDAAKKVGKVLVQQAGRLLSKGEEAQGNQLLMRGSQAQQEAKIKAMINLASSEAGMRICASALDRDPYLLGVQNGVVQLRTGTLLAAEPSMYITKSCNAAYDPNASCPRWLQFLADIFPQDPDTVETVQRLLGYTLTGLNSEEILVICVGYGSNGKSVFGNVIHRIMGDYAQHANGSILTINKAGDGGSPRPDVAALAGCRYVGINETQAGDRLDARLVKVLAGREPITTRNLYQAEFTFVPQFTPWLRTNHKPRIHETDDGIWRRLLVLPFRRKFSETEQDPGLEQKLMAEQDGILGWMIEGAVKFLSHTEERLKISQTIKVESCSYRKESDVLGEFLEDAVIQAPDAKVDQTAFYRSYTDWCKSNGHRPATKTSITRRLKVSGFEESKSGSKRYYCGLELSEHGHWVQLTL